MSEIMGLNSEIYSDVHKVPGGEGGIYFIMLGCLFLYIGNADSLYRRIKFHDYEKLWRHDKKYIIIRYLVCNNSSERKKMEIELIQRFKPVYNRDHNKFYQDALRVYENSPTWSKTGQCAWKPATRRESNRLDLETLNA